MKIEKLSYRIIVFTVLTTYLFCSQNFSKDQIDSLNVWQVKAANYYFDREFESADKYGKKILSIDSTNSSSYLYIGDYHASNKEFKKSYKYLSLSIEYDKENIFAYYSRALSSMIISNDLRFCSDIDVVEDLMEKDPDFEYLKDRSPMFLLCEAKHEIINNSWSFVDSGIQLLVEGHTIWGRMFLNEAIRLQPDNDKAHYNISISYAGEKKEEEHLLKAIEINPQNDWAHRNLGYHYYNSNNDTKAVEYFENAAALGNTESKEWLLNNIEIKPY